MLDNYKDILTVDDLMEILNYKSKTTVYKMLRNGTIKSVHSKGNKYLIPKVNVISFLIDKE